MAVSHTHWTSRPSSRASGKIKLTFHTTVSGLATRETTVQRREHWPPKYWPEALTRGCEPILFVGFIFICHWLQSQQCASDKAGWGINILICITAWEIWLSLICILFEGSTSHPLLLSQTTFSNAYSWMKSFLFPFKIHWYLFLRVQWTIRQHWFR